MATVCLWFVEIYHINKHVVHLVVTFVNGVTFVLCRNYIWRVICSYIEINYVTGLHETTFKVPNDLLILFITHHIT